VEHRGCGGYPPRRPERRHCRSGQKVVQLVGELVRRQASTHCADLVRSGKPVNVDAAAGSGSRPPWVQSMTWAWRHSWCELASSGVAIAVRDLPRLMSSGGCAPPEVVTVRTTVHRELHTAQHQLSPAAVPPAYLPMVSNKVLLSCRRYHQLSTMWWIAASRGPRTSVNASAAGAPGPHRAPPARPLASLFR
jgi:hypothetical protein